MVSRQGQPATASALTSLHPAQGTSKCHHPAQDHRHQPGAGCPTHILCSWEGHRDAGGDQMGRFARLACKRGQLIFLVENHQDFCWCILYKALSWRGMFVMIVYFFSLQFSFQIMEM